ncbi:tRNA (guanosine(18)-2'-O)-methyltransferase TrmH [Parashewanella tropica]|uniref:tRNA (guanosine(18)-2'-O)-methyltransferase TrmH n=1 Tax=Parashewanella tropica TaxID=2547970 RepID=UPI0010599BC7|nr:tRNA (guanosine(18)-2'-O)-methyltransferase TrmH [Parashewanella tropica]
MTPERFARINDMLNHRQPDLTVCLDQVHKPNNISAVVRTADAVGIHEVHAIWPDPDMRVSGNTASGSQQWVNVKKHYQVKEAFDVCRAQGMQIIVTNFSDQAVDYREIDYTKPTAIVLGHEKDGVSAEALALADKQVIIPMVGMVQSLNVSVAAALMLFEAKHQREQAGLYGTNQLPYDYCQKLLFEQGHPIYAKACRKKGIPYPNIDENGQIDAPDTWFEALRTTPDLDEFID